MSRILLASLFFVQKARLGGLKAVALGAFLLAAFSLFAQRADDVFPPKPSQYVAVHDYAAWLTPDEKLRLETRLQQYEDRTTTQIVVMIRPEIGDYDKSGYATELGLRWDVGQKGKNNGLIILVKTEMPYRGAFIASGYGAEGALPDGLLGEIVRTRMIPLFKNEQNFEGLSAGLDAIEKALAGEFQAEKAEPQSATGFLVILFLMLFLICLFAWMSYKFRQKMGETYSGRGVRRHPTVFGDRGMGGGWWVGGGGSSGGGWGGGSSSGGGGWSSGGFGGGDFGGGGAGGDW